MKHERVFVYSIILAVGLLLVITQCAPAKAETYLKLSAGPTKMKPSVPGLWNDVGNGYQRLTDSQPMISVGFGISRPRYNIEYGFIMLGKMEMDALWGNPDVPNSRDYKTAVGVQSGTINGLFLTYSPKIQFNGGNIHLNLGAIYSKATWKGDHFFPENPYSTQFEPVLRMKTKQLGYFVGFGATIGDSKSLRFSVDLNHYPIDIDSGKYKNTYGGSGGYEAVTALEFSVKVPI